MKQHSKTRQLKVLRAAKHLLEIKSRRLFFRCLCHALEKAEEDLYRIVDDNNYRLLVDYGLTKYRPRGAGSVFWWGLNEAGRQKRVTVLNKRIKELSKKK